MPPIVNIYIDIKFKGDLGDGEGEYSIVLETIRSNGEPYTKEHYGGYKGTTINRLSLYACIHALKYIRLPSEIVFHISNAYVANTVSRGLQIKWQQQGWVQSGRQIKNAGLWERYIKLADGHFIFVVEEKENTYSKAMAIQAGFQKINYITDYREENKYV